MHEFFVRVARASRVLAKASRFREFFLVPFKHPSRIFKERSFRRDAETSARDARATWITVTQK